MDIPVKITVINRFTEDDSCIYHGHGVQYAGGRIEFTAKVKEGETKFELDPAEFNEEDPKRCIATERNVWSKYRVRSIIVDSKKIIAKSKKV